MENYKRTKIIKVIFFVGLTLLGLIGGCAIRFNMFHDIWIYLTFTGVLLSTIAAFFELMKIRGNKAAKHN